MYGHQIRRDARIDCTELWSEVKPGSLYAALHRLQAEGLIEPVRTEQQGNLPARTVYAITAEGRRELRALRAEALREVALRPDPVDLALAVSADLDEDTLRGFFASRREALSGRAAFFERERGEPDQSPADDLIIEHLMARIETELRWHDMVLDRSASSARAASPQTPVTIRELRLLGDPVLRTECDPVTRFDDALGRLVDDLLENVLLPGRAGLAAPQIGVSLAAFSYNVDGQHGYVINPVVIETSGEYDGPEGCLSIPGITADTLRAARTVVTGVDRHGDPVTVVGEGELSRCPAARDRSPARHPVHRPAHRRAPQGGARSAPPGGAAGQRVSRITGHRGSRMSLPVVRRAARSSWARAA